jgi:hypothetical protein
MSRIDTRTPQRRLSAIGKGRRIRSVGRTGAGCIALTFHLQRSLAIQCYFASVMLWRVERDTPMPGMRAARRCPDQRGAGAMFAAALAIHLRLQRIHKRGPRIRTVIEAFPLHLLVCGMAVLDRVQGDLPKARHGLEISRIGVCIAEGTGCTYQHECRNGIGPATEVRGGAC